MQMFEYENVFFLDNIFGFLSFSLVELEQTLNPKCAV